MPQFRLTKTDGGVLQEWDAPTALTAEEQAVREITRHRLDGSPGGDFRLEEERPGGWVTVGRWGPLAP